MPWTTTKSMIILNNFTIEARIWLMIICSYVPPSINITSIPLTQAQMVACIRDKILLNVVNFVLSDLRAYKSHGGPILIFPFLITELYKWAGVEECLRETRISPKTSIYPLKMHSEGAPSKSKKSKINTSKLV